MGKLILTNKCMEKKIGYFRRRHQKQSILQKNSISQNGVESCSAWEVLKRGVRSTQRDAWEEMFLVTRVD